QARPAHEPPRLGESTSGARAVRGEKGPRPPLELNSEVGEAHHRPGAAPQKHQRSAECLTPRDLPSLAGLPQAPWRRLLRALGAHGPAATTDAQAPGIDATAMSSRSEIRPRPIHNTPAPPRMRPGGATSASGMPGATRATSATAPSTIQHRASTGAATATPVARATAIHPTTALGSVVAAKPGGMSR